MKTSETISKLAVALLAAQKAITFASKDASNPFFKSKYADLPTVIDAVKPALNDAGIVFIQSATPSDSGTLSLVTRLIHESGEWIEDTAIAPLQKNDPQGYGSAITYLRRYSLAAITGLYQDDDDGQAASHTIKGQGKGVHKPTQNENYQPDADELVYLSSIVDQVLANKDNYGSSADYLEGQKLDSDEKVWVWDKLDSKTRSGIKKYNAENKESK
jgi:hypothetical protein